MSRTRNKTAATWLALLGGGMGLHRFYLHGWRDPAGWLLPLPTLLGLYGVLRARTLGVEDAWASRLMPLLGFTLAGCALCAILYGLTPALRWNARHNPDAPSDAAAGRSNWLTVLGLVLALGGGATVLLATLVFSLQRMFEYQLG